MIGQKLENSQKYTVTRGVTILSSLPPVTGASLYTKFLIQELSKEIPVDVLGFNKIYPAFLYPGDIYDYSAKPLEEHEKLKIKNVLNWYNPFRWILEAFRIRTTIIHAQWWSFPLAPLYVTILGIGRLLNKKIILTIHNVEPHEKSFIKGILNCSVFFLGDEYIVHTRQGKEALERIIKHKRVHIIPHGSINPLTTVITKQDARETLKVGRDDKILLFWGHIRDYKGLDVALKAMGLIKAANVKLLIAGKCWENWEKYQRLIDQYQLGERVILRLGYIPDKDMDSFFKASDLVLLPYKYFDAQSGVGALVLSYGIPMIVSATGGLPDYVSNQECVIQPDEYKDLAAKIERILSDAQLYSQLISDIHKKNRMLSWENVARETIQVYEQCIRYKTVSNG